MAFTGIKLLGSDSKSGSGYQSTVAEAFGKSSGQLIVGLIAAVIAGIGIYQLYYGWSEKYRKHVDAKKLDGKVSTLLARAGKIGYISRGIVWLIISLFFFKAAFSSNSGEAGGTGKALGFIQDFPYGTYLLGLIGLGFICYGVFNFLRAAYERFETT